MRSSEHILVNVSRTIALMHNRPAMYIASTNRPNAAELFDGMMHIVHEVWAMAIEREKDLHSTLGTLRQEQHQTSTIGFADGCRKLHPQCDEQSIFEHVRACWSEVDARLGIDISMEATRTPG